MQKIIIAKNIKERIDGEESFLDREEVRILPAVSNREVLEIHSAEKADLIIANLVEDVLSGELLCSNIRDNKELCRVSLIIIHSGAASDMMRISACRANAFLEKNVDPAILLSKTRQLMSIPERETYRTPIGLKVLCDMKNSPFQGYSENISVTGMLVDSEKILSKGEIISCCFVLPDSIHVKTDAEIVRIDASTTEHDTNRYGIRFLDLEDEFRTAIKDYVGKRKRLICEKQV
jgi:CheY-like chemotaxis protein